MNLLEELKGQVLDGKYQIDRQLGQGGMGAVFLATHLGTKRPVALKIIIPQFITNKEFIERFKREAEATGRLCHPNIVNVTDFGFANLGKAQIGYLVMEYLSGFSLGDLLEKKKTLPLSFVVDVVEQISLAMDVAHKQGIVHRDLKPDNIWLEPTGRGNFNVKILDFGLAKFTTGIPTSQNDDNNAYSSDFKASRQLGNVVMAPLTVSIEENASSDSVITKIQSLNTYSEDKVLKRDTDSQVTLVEQKKTVKEVVSATTEENLTSVGAILGTPLYMSPEQCCGKSLDLRSDIYSLGIIVYQMLAGNLPFKGNLESLIFQHTKAKPPDLRKLNRKIPKSIEAVIIKALAKNPLERFPTASALAIALRINADGEGVLLNQAIDIYRKEFFTFFKLSFTSYFPFLALVCLLMFSLKIETKSIVDLSINQFYWVLVVAFLLIGNTINSAAFALVIKELRLNSTGNIDRRLIISSLLKFYPRLSLGIIKSYLSSLSKLLSVIKPFKQTTYNSNSMFASVIVLEEKPINLALERSKLLVEQFKAIAFGIEIRSLFITLVALFIFSVTFVVWGVPFDILTSEVYRGRIYGWLELIAVIFTFFPPFLFIPSLFIIIAHPVVAIAKNLLYFKAYQTLEGNAKDTPKDQPLEYLTLVESQKIFSKRKLALAAILGLLFFIQTFLADKVLFFAAQNDYVNTLESLLAMGVDVNERYIYGDGETALIIAAAYNNSRVVKVLLDKGAEVNIQDAKGNTALILAARNGNVAIVNMLLGKKAEVNLKNKDGELALFFASIAFDLGEVLNKEQILELLLKDGADVNSIDKKGKTPLMMASEIGSTGVIEILLNKGANINAKNFDGQTALMCTINSFAPIERKLKNLRMLLDKGADPYIKNAKGQTALMVAIDYKSPQIIEVFKEKNIQK